MRLIYAFAVFALALASKPIVSEAAQTYGQQLTEITTLIDTSAKSINREVTDAESTIADFDFGPRCREGFKTHLARPLHRIFILNPEGKKCFWYNLGWTSVERAVLGGIDYCASRVSGGSCLVYSINNQIVYDKKIWSNFYSKVYGKPFEQITQTANVDNPKALTIEIPTSGAIRKDEVQRRQTEAVAKAEEERRQKEALAEQQKLLEANTRLAEQLKASEASFQQKEKELIAKLAQAEAQLNRNSNYAAATYNTRKAILIGNNKYSSVSQLQNAIADANAVAKVLTNLGYAVSRYNDLNEKTFKKALRDFKLQIQGGDEIVFFYAGHGVQINGANYLLPIDINPENDSAVRDEGIDLKRVLDEFASVQAKVTVAIIDACRDNPFKTSSRSSATRGLAATSAASGQIILFSAGEGQQALDKLGPTDKEPNGLFTRSLLKYLGQTELSVDQVARKVRQEVATMAKGVGREQVPAIYDQLVGDFYFSK